MGIMEIRNDLISRAAAIRALVSSNGDYLDALERFEKIPAVDAMPVEWLREKIQEHTDEGGWQDYLANSFGLCIEYWQNEQEER